MRARVAVVLLATLATAAAGAGQLVAAHEGHEGLEDQLVSAGDRLLLGSFTAPQPGPLIVVPHHDGALGCDPPEDGAYRLPIGSETGLMLAANETLVRAYFDSPPDALGYRGFAVDTHDATRALLMMRENAVALHALVGLVASGGDNGTAYTASTGAMGIPYPIPGEADHAHGAPSPQSVMLMAHDDSFGAPEWCVSGDGHAALAFRRADLPGSLSPGRLVHAVALVDPDLDRFPPRVIDSTTHLELNLYLAQPYEDANAVRAALAAGGGLSEFAVLALLALGGAWLVMRPDGGSGV